MTPPVAQDRDERTILRDHLHKRGQKLTAPRMAILESFLRLERHVTADELFVAARRISPGIGLATVFRTIKLLAGAGIARETCSETGAKQYEHVYRHLHHDHLLCTRCGAVLEFHDDAIERAQLAIYRRYGYTPSGHRLELRGECPSCAKRPPDDVGQESR